MPSRVGDVVVLVGKTGKGKNRVREHGDHWLVREIDRSVLSPNLGYLVCPASYIGTEHLMPGYDTPRSLGQRDGYCRWVRKTRDEHFEVVTRDDLLAELEAVVKRGSDRQAAASDPSIGALRPTASDWMSADEIARMSDLQALLVPFSWRDREDARRRVAVRRAARLAARS